MKKVSIFYVLLMVLFASNTVQAQMRRPASVPSVQDRRDKDTVTSSVPQKQVSQKQAKKGKVKATSPAATKTKQTSAKTKVIDTVFRDFRLSADTTVRLYFSRNKIVRRDTIITKDTIISSPRTVYPIVYKDEKYTVPQVEKKRVKKVVSTLVETIQDVVTQSDADSVTIIHNGTNSDGDAYVGFTRKIPYHQMIPPYGLEVTYDKTVHILFPSPIRYIDYGSDVLLAAVAGDASNVLRVKSALQLFEGETNLSVITESGSFYSFNVKYTKEPDKLSIEMKDFTHDGNAVNRPNNSLDVFLKELNNESPQLVRLIMESIHKNNKRAIKHIGSRNFGIQFLLKGIYSYKGMLYFFVEINNKTNVNFEIDYLTMKIVDKKLIKRTTIQETVIKPVRAYNYVMEVSAKRTECVVMAIPIFTIPSDKALVFDLNEKHNGGRNQVFEIQNEDLVKANEIKNFIVQ
jgi:conjugative transposon TraN protein